MVTNENLLELFDRHVRFDAETVTDTKTWPDSLGVVVVTEGRLLAIRSDPDFLRIGRAPWVDTLVVAERQDVLTHGEPETDTVAVDTSGGSHYLNDPLTVAALGRRVGDSLDPVAYAEVLVAYHPWSVARRTLLTVAGPVPGVTAGPVVAPPVLDGGRLEFWSSAVYAPMTGAALRCDVHRWRVDLAPDADATWTREPVAEKLTLSP